MKSGCVKEERKTRRPSYLDKTFRRERTGLLRAKRSRVLPPMGSFDVNKAPALHVREIDPEFHLSWNSILNQFLIVPGIAMPAVEVALGRQRLPTLGLNQLERVAQILAKCRYDNRMQGGI